MAYATNSSGLYSGTIVVSPIRPYSPSASFATVFSNEIKGAHHTYETLSERDAIIEARRDWGMLVTVYNDGSNNKTYELKYNWVDTNINNNSNWVVYNPAGVNSSEWIDSVQEYVTQPLVFTDGYRYLVKPTGVGSFSSYDNQIAVYNLLTSTFSFYSPTESQTLRVDNIKNVIFKYQSGAWVEEYLNQVRYISATSANGLSYSAVSSGQNSVDIYSYSVYYVSFGSTNSGTVSLSIDGLPYIEVKKLLNNTLSTVSAGDIVPNLEYQLIYNSGNFQTTLPNASTTTIGAAEDGDYTDGLYTDFITSTPIGTAVDRFNEVLKLLVPESAPGLTSWSALGSFVNGGISFDNSTSGSLVTATSSPYGAVAKGGTFSSNDSIYRLGITSKVAQPITGNTYYQDITGVFNNTVGQSLQTPTPAYATYSFGYGKSGTVSLFINGTDISKVFLSGGTAVDNTSGGATSGLNIFAATSSKFPGGYAFETHQNRTGSFVIKKDNPYIVNGYNYITVEHNTGTFNYVLSRYEWVADGATAQVSVTNPQITTVNTTTTNYLSGIEYWNGYIEFVYDATLGNLFRNTFVLEADALEYRDVSVAASTPGNPVTNTVTVSDSNQICIPTQAFSALIPNGSYDPAVTMLASMTFSVPANRRRLNDTISFAVTVKRTVQGTFSGGTSSNGGPVQTLNWFIDTYGTSSTTTLENFDDEEFRLKNGTDKYNTYHLESDIAAGDWNSAASLLNDTDHYNGLQVINSALVYPTFDFDGVGDVVVNPNAGAGSSRVYSNCNSVVAGFGTSSIAALTSNRTYTRWFNLGNFNYSKATLRIYYSTPTTFVNADQPLTGNSLWIECKLPYSSGTVPGGTQSGGAVTGWLDLTKPFISGEYSDGDGCYEGVVPTVSGADWLINFGIKGTQYSNGYVLVRVTAPDGWARAITSIELVGRI